MSSRFLLFLLLSTLALSTASANDEAQQIFTLYYALLNSLGDLLDKVLNTSGGVMEKIPITSPLVGANGRPLNIDLQQPLGGLGKGVDGIVGSVLGTVIKAPSVSGSTAAPVAATTQASG